MPEDHNVARTVVRFLGFVALLAAAGSIFLVYESIGYEGIDPATVALVNVPGNLASAALGALGAILATAGRQSGQQPSGTPADPVNVQTAEKPLEVTPVTDDVHPDAPDSSDL